MGADTLDSELIGAVGLVHWLKLLRIDVVLLKKWQNFALPLTLDWASRGRRDMEDMKIFRKNLSRRLFSSLDRFDLPLSPILSASIWN